MTSRPDIAFLVLDSLRADYCSCLGATDVATPTLDRLAEDGCLYTNVRSTASWTVPAIASIFTGRLPSEIGTHAESKQFRAATETTLAGQLQSTGYRTYGVSSNPWLAPEFGFDAGFDELVRVRPEFSFPDAGDPRDEHWSGPWREKLPDIGRWLLDANPLRRAVNLIEYYQLEDSYAAAPQVTETLRHYAESADSGPVFLFANYMDPHEPYAPVDDDGRMQDGQLDVNWNLDSLVDPPKVDHDTITSAYGAAAEYTDEQIGRLLSSLDDDGRLDEMFVAVVGDHGQALGEHGFWGHGTFLHESLVHVPAIIRPPKSWDSDAVPETINEPCSLRWFHELICDCASVTDVNEISFSPNSDANKPVISESHGSPQDVTVPLPADQSARSRLFYFPDGQVTRLENGVELLVTDGNISSKRARELIEIARATDADLPSLKTKTANEDEMDPTTQKQLEDLGYM